MGDPSAQILQKKAESTIRPSSEQFAGVETQQQTYSYDAVYPFLGRRYRVQIRRDKYSEQSYARVYVWSSPASQWNEVWRRYDISAMPDGYSKETAKKMESCRIVALSLVLHAIGVVEGIDETAIGKGKASRCQL